MSDDPRQEYDAARIAYADALARLREAKRHIPPSPRDRRRQRIREEQEAKHARYLANKTEIDAYNNEIIRRAINTLRDSNKYLQIIERQFPENEP